MDDFELLTAALGQQRAHVLEIVEGLDDLQLTTSMLPSVWSPAGLIQHLALDVERNWFRDVFDGQAINRDDDPARAWDVPPGGGLAALDRYREECALADKVIVGHSSSEEPKAWPERWANWRLSSLYEIMLHVVTETACHAGHLDIVRESIDGTQFLVLD